MRLVCLPRQALTVGWMTMCLCGWAVAQTAPALITPRDRSHESEQWKVIEPHLPNPSTASEEVLETQADILRARRFPEDALDFYNYALAKGGNAARLLNKQGLAELEMRNVALARAMFQHSVKLNKKNAEAWNNLGAAEYMNGSPKAALVDYKKAVKLDKAQAVFHANLATTYFESKEYDSARREIGIAMKLDPQIFERRNGDGGIAAHVLSSEDRARFSYEMAKMYARNGLEEEMLHSLAMASEAGMDIQREMRKDQVLAKLADDPRIVTLVHNAAALRASRASGGAAASPLPPAPKPIAE